MKCSTASWTVTAAAAALLALPVAVAAQTPPATQPPATTQPTTPPPADPAQTAAPAQGSAQEHLRQAKAALDDVGTANLSARARTQVAELKKRMITLERSAGVTATTGPTGTSGKRATRSTANWGTELAAMDKILTSLLDSATTGAAGTTAPATNKAATAVSLDDATRAKLTEVRTHLTAFATAMTAPPGSPTTAGPAPEPTTTPTITPTPTPREPAPTTPPATQPATPPATQPTTSAAAQPGAAPAKVDEAAARRHLTEARNTLSQLTQLPAAAQLTGDARTQVSQLISNFNELITTQSNWQAAYGKVSANLTALIGPHSAAPAPSGTAGAVGTSGSGAALDPALREKLVELRKHLAEFERASGGAAAAASTPDPAPSAPAPTTPEPTPAPSPSTPPATSAPAAPAASDALTHIAAIETLLKSQNEGGGMTLDKTQVELLRTHIAELRRLLEKK